MRLLRVSCSSAPCCLHKIKAGRTAFIWDIISCWGKRHYKALHYKEAKELVFKASAPKCGEGNGTPLQDSCVENHMDGGAWWAAVHGVAKSQTRLSDFTFPFHFHALEKEMATHSSVLAWRIPGTGEPGGLPSMGLRRVGHDWSDLAAAAAAPKWHVSLWTIFNWPKQVT